MLGPRVGPAWEIRASQPHELFTGTASSGSQAAPGAEIAPSRDAWLRWEEGGGKRGERKTAVSWGQLRDTSALQDQLMQREEGVSSLGNPQTQP